MQHALAYGFGLAMVGVQAVHTNTFRKGLREFLQQGWRSIAAAIVHQHQVQALVGSQAIAQTCHRQAQGLVVAGDHQVCAHTYRPYFTMHQMARKPSFQPIFLPSA